MQQCADQLRTAISAARKAGKVIMAGRGRSPAAEKAANNLVTEADIKAQEAIISLIRKRYPGHSIIAEENDLTAKIDASDLWIIDPLDGTHNFAHGIPHFSVSIAYARLGTVVAGIVFDPTRGEIFSALQGGGAYLNGRPIRVSQTQTLKKAIVTTGFYYDRDQLMRKTLDSIEKLFAANIHGIRRFGSAALDLCWVACGRFDAYFEYKLSIWDFAAGMLILAEAGGRLADQRGQRLDLTSTGLVVSNGYLHGELLDKVRWPEEFQA